MATLHITRGLPASGKSTWARAWTAEDRAHRVRINRDDLRKMLDDGVHVKGLTEQRVIAARDAAITRLLRDGYDVVSDDTNLPQKMARDLARLAHAAGAGFEVHDFTGVPLETCVERDAAREHPVGADRIKDLHLRFLAGRKHPLPLPEDIGKPVVPYEAKQGTPRAVLVDIDGTTALISGRSPYDSSRVHQDLPNTPVIEVVRAMHAAGNRIVFLSGRPAECHDETAAWLALHVGVPFEGLFMRPTGDSRKDAVVKIELFDAHVRDAYDVVCVLDDRDQVVEAWRALGLTVLQVAEGDF
ncbi:AAA family ATPase [Actinocorallia longicatena]|uniref:Polynucleotide kinase PNKP phosphatase domain-containing protein n=1 Tax=Actinocorallia longicatena TaxID=111803 RepID=A0ABP6PWE2_9ACTN